MLRGASRATWPLRALHVSLRALAAAPAGKKKVKLGFKKEGAKEKVKRSGMTHLKFRDAVRALNFERGAADASVPVLGAQPAALAGAVAAYSPQHRTQLGALGAFKKYQHHELFKQPVALVGDNTVRLHEQFVARLGGSSGANRVCLSGEGGSGRSTLMAQAQAMALAQYGDVVLLHVDHPERLVEGSSDYVYNKDLGKYQQPMFTKRWIQKVRAANEAVFRKMPLSQDVSFTTKKVRHDLKAGTHTLHDYVLQCHDFGTVGPTAALQFFLREVQHHANTFPVLVSVDNFNALTVEPYTKYYNPDMSRTQFTDFEFGHMLAQLACGDVTFAKGGVLLAESSDNGVSATLNVALGRQQPDLYAKIHECDVEMAAVLARNGGITPFHVENLSKAHTRALMQFYADTGVLQVRPWPSKPAYAKADEAGLKVGEFAVCADPDEQFESILEMSFFVSSGNPSELVKFTAQLM